MPSILRSYSHFSLLSALPKVKNLAAKIKDLGYAGIALTDEDNGAGLVEFHTACKDKEIKPIFGVQLRLPNLSHDNTDSGFKGVSNYTKITLLARNEIGRIKLYEIITRARLEFDQPKPYIPVDILKSYFQDSDLILGICGNDSEISGLIKKNNFKSLKSTLKQYVEIFGVSNLFCELLYPGNRISGEECKNGNLKLIEICQELGLIYVASPAPRYLEKDDREAFQAVLGIRDGVQMSGITLDRDYYIPSIDELNQIYSYAPESIENTDKILDLVHNTFETKPIADIFPYFEIPEGHNYSQTLLWETLIGFMFMFGPEKKTRAELREIYAYETVENLRELILKLKVDTSKLFSYPADYWSKKEPIDYLNRIESELGIINDKGYPTYFLVVADFIQFARDSDIVVNTRGSGAGSLVAYLNGITIIDPLLYTIPFERFLNPMRPSTPDFDCDIADDRRDDIIAYVTKKYGADKVCQIITFGTMLPRMVVRDVGRTLGVSYKKCDRIAKLIPLGKQGSKMTFDKALEQSEELANVLAQDEDAQHIIAISRKLEGNYRHASVHAAGVIITPTKLTDFTPLQWDSDHQGIVCQLDMNSAEKSGMVKMDFLGIRNLSTLGNTIHLVKERHGEKVDLSNVDLRSKKAFELLAKGRTMGIFQLSGGGITRFLIELEPSRVEDLMAMVALYRPGPMPNIPEYIRRKHDPSSIKYYVPQMEKWMKDSYGILVYQDDLLYTVIELAGYDWAEVDIFRKGVGKKVRAIIDSQHEKFVAGCQTHSGLTKETAEFLWSLMEPFAAYGFNKAHAAAYGMVSYWTAYMKGEYTVEFMTTLMTEESNNLDKVANAIKECQELNIEVLPPDINDSGDSFTIIDDHHIRYGFTSVKNLGSDVIKYIIRERQKKGRYTSFDDFLSRISTYANFNKRSLEALIHAGCLDRLILDNVKKLNLFQKDEFKHFEEKNTFAFLRSFLMANVESILEALTALKHGSQVESDSLFGFDTAQNIGAVAWNTNFTTSTKQQILQDENEVLGIYLTDNPMREFEPIEKRIQLLTGKTDFHLGLVTKVKKIFTKTNSLMFALQVITPTDNYEAVIFPKNALELSPRLEENRMFWIKGKISAPKPRKKDEQTEFDEMVKNDESLKKMAEADDPDAAQESAETQDKVQEYEELPKILVNNLVDFNLGILPLVDNERDLQKYEPIFKSVIWSNILEEPETLDNYLPAKKLRAKLGQAKTEEDARIEELNLIDQNNPNTSFSRPYVSPYLDPQVEEVIVAKEEIVEASPKIEPKEPENLNPAIIKISLNDGPNKLREVRSSLIETQEVGYIPVQLEVEVESNVWKRTKKVWYGKEDLL